MFGSKYLRRWFGASRESEAEDRARQGIGILASVRTDPGIVRAENEDAVIFSHSVDPIEAEKRGSIAVVADGMGGQEGGEIASEIAARIVTASYLASRDEPPAALRKAFESANAEIYRRARREPHLQGMGATCVALALRPPCAWVAWVGDSRLYLVRGGQIFQMTEDHSVVNEMVRNGLLTPEEAFNHEDRNVVTRALGSGRKVEVAVWDEPYPVRAGDRFLLCSDGLHDALKSSEMLEIILSGNTDAAADRLIHEANLRGGYDNISAILLELASPSSSPPGPVPATRLAPPLSEVSK